MIASRLVKLLFLLSFVIPVALPAQHPLEGVWKMVSIKGKGVDGKSFSLDTTSAREIKIITPTHYMLMAYSLEGDSLVFNRTYVGTIKLEGNKYIETPLVSSLPIFDNVKSDFTWKREGNRFIQSGTFTRPDGKTVTLDELVFEKVPTQSGFANNPAIGAWTQTSSEYTDFDGLTHTANKGNDKCILIITPTHWMRLSHTGGKFDKAMLGTYAFSKGKAIPTIEYASFNSSEISKIETVSIVKNGKLIESGTITAPNGKVLNWSSVFEKF